MDDLVIAPPTGAERDWAAELLADSEPWITIGAHTGSAVMAAICLAFATAFVLCVEGPFWAIMMRIAGKSSGTAGDIMNMGSNLGGLLSPALTSVHVDL